MTTTAMNLVTAAKAGIENLTPGEVKSEITSNGVLLVDVREPTETQNGIIPGALLAPRGMLEFHADASTPYHLEEFSVDRRVIVYCAAGSRSALAAKTLQDLGYSDVAHLDSGFKGWQEAGYPIEQRES